MHKAESRAAPAVGLLYLIAGGGENKVCPVFAVEGCAPLEPALSLPKGAPLKVLRSVPAAFVNSADRTKTHHSFALLPVLKGLVWLPLVN